MRRAIGSALAVVGLVAAAVSPAAATPGSTPPVTPRSGSSTELVFTSTGAGQAVTGYIASASSSFDPLTGYPPAANPPGPNFNVLNEGFAGILRGTTPGGTPNAVSLYCIDILTSTYTGVGYVQGTWNESSVARVGYVAQLLNNYYPAVPTAPTAPNNNQRAAAVQAAIWFFTDRYVLNANDPIRPIVEGIVANVLALGPLVEPPPPALSITPASLTGTVSLVLGPYTPTVGGGATMTVTSTGADMFADAAATQPIAQGATVASGSPIYLRSFAIGAATLVARATLTVPTGNVYVYDQNTPGLNVAQRLILAATAQVASTAVATGLFTELPPATTAPTTTTTTTTTTTVPATTTTVPGTSTTTSVPGTSTSTSVSPTSIANTTTTDPGSLPGTGSDSGNALFAALVALAGGVFLLLLARRFVD